MLPLLLSPALPAPQDGSPPSLPDRQLPPLVRSAIAAVRGGDGAELERLFPSRLLTGAGTSPSQPLSGDRAVRMLRACTLGKTWLLYEGSYVIDYSCPARRKVARGCETGDLAVNVNLDASPSFFLNLRRRLGPDCPVYVPPPPG